MKLDNLKTTEKESSTSFLLHTESIFAIAYPSIPPEAFETNQLLIQKYLLGLQLRKLKFTLEKIGNRKDYTLSDVWSISILYETIHETINIKLPQGGYSLFPKHNNTINAVEDDVKEENSLDEESDVTNTERDEVINYMTSMDKGKKRIFVRKNFNRKCWNKKNDNKYKGSGRGCAIW